MSETTTKRHHVTREEEADRDLNGTQFSKGSAVAVTLTFLAFVFGIPIAQHVVEIRENMAKRKETPAGQPEPSLAPKIYDVVKLLPTKEQLAQAKGFWGYWDLIPSTESITAFEEEVKQSSILTQALLSPAQQILTGTFGVGNEKAYCGQPGWLFYRPDVEYLTSDGFLDPHVLRSRSHQSTEIQPNPVKAILDFKRQLDQRHIKLIVVPMPTKPMIEPEMLVGPREKGVRLQNPSYGQFLARMKENGVNLYDPTDLLLQRKTETGHHQYLETDTHWTPDAMAAVSQDLSDFVRRQTPLPATAASAFDAKKVSVSNLGDIAEMLKLPKGQTMYRPQTVETEQIDGATDRAGDVLLLGDSFSNIFSKEEMNWGKSSGFAEHLARALGRRVDPIVINAGGSFSSRRELARQMYQSDRLAGKKVVIYEFSMRDLSQGDWKMIALPTPPKTAPNTDPNPPVTPPKTVAQLELKGVEPAAFDPAKGEQSTVKLFAPAGKWTVAVLDADGKTVRKLAAQTQAADGDAEAKWDGKQDDGKPATPGAYKISVSGVRPDGGKLAPVTASVLVEGDAPVGKIEAIGATPERIDSVAKQKTSIDFSVSEKATYEAELLDPNGKRVKKLDKQTAGPGVLHFRWDGVGADGKPAADGTYTVRVSTADAKSKPAPATATVQVKSVVKPVTPDKTPPVAQELIVTGRIASRGAQPQAGAYKDAVLALQLTDLQVTGGKIGNANILVYVWGMRDNKLVDGAYQVGQTITFKLVPWDKVESKYGSFNRIDLSSDDYYTWPTYWGEVKR